MSSENRYLALLIGIVLVKAIIMVWIVLHGGIGLGPDEAQYWTWSQQLDWGYYSKPPGIAWQIWLGAQLFGNTELGVRFFSIVLGSLLPLSIYFLARSCQLQSATACLAGVIMALSPMGFMAAFLAITDIGMMLFWTLSCAVFTKGLAEQKPPNYILIGLLIMCGALFKWPIYTLWIIFIVWMLVYRGLATPQLIVGIPISLLGLLPSVIWNMTHQWATFRHVGATIAGQHANDEGVTILKGNLIAFLGAQAALLSPILFILLLFAFVHLMKQRSQVQSTIAFCGYSCFAILAVFSCMALFQKMQGNWSDFAYPTGIVLLAWYVNETVSKKMGWTIAGLLVSIVLIAGTFALPYVQSNAILSHYPIPYKMNPFKHNIGWNRLPNALEQAGYDASQHFLFSDKYQMASILSFYGPQQKRAYFFNLHGIRKNQFSFWPGMAQEQVGKTGFFVIAENAAQETLAKLSTEYSQLLGQYFDEVKEVKKAPLFDSYGKTVKGALIFKCIGYNGRDAANVERF